MIKITYFVHGTTTDNEQRISTGWAPGELSTLGIEQAKELKDQTKEMHFDIVFCSGIFNLNLGDNVGLLNEALGIFFKLAREAVVFNLLDEGSPDKDNRYYYFSQDRNPL